MQYLLNKLLIISFAFGIAMSSPIQLASADTVATCQSKEIANAKIAALCAAISNDERSLEYLHCWPSKANKDQSVTHYIFQKTYSDRENFEGEALGSLFSGTGKAQSTTRELKNVEIIDGLLEPLSSLDLAFIAKTAHLYFDLMIIATDGDALEGTVTDTVTNLKTEISCLDISLEK
jgi:hypothetical protein